MFFFVAFHSISNVIILIFHTLRNILMHVLLFKYPKNYSDKDLIDLTWISGLAADITTILVTKNE